LKFNQYINQKSTIHGFYDYKLNKVSPVNLYKIKACQCKVKPAI